MSEKEPEYEHGSPEDALRTLRELAGKLEDQGVFSDEINVMMVREMLEPALGDIEKGLKWLRAKENPS